MINISPNGAHWGGSINTLQNYINGYGTNGMPPLQVPILFPILNRATASEIQGQMIEKIQGQIIEKHYNNNGPYKGFIQTHYRRIDSNGNPFGPLLPSRDKKVKLSTNLLKNLQGYHNEAVFVYGADYGLVQPAYNSLLASLRQNGSI